jgi:hypothetical protein
MAALFVAAQDAYLTFLREKMALAPVGGFDIALADLNGWMKEHAKAAVRWALAGGRRAIFASFGLAKTSMQLEMMAQCQARLGGHTLIVHPLGVRQEFYRDATSMGISVKFIRGADEIDPAVQVHLTNYETVRDGKLDPALFCAASLDEASVLRGFGGTKTFREFMRLFDRCLTASSPPPRPARTNISSCWPMPPSWASWMWARPRPASSSATAKRPTTSPCTRTRKKNSGCGWPAGRCSSRSPAIWAFGRGL